MITLEELLKCKEHNQLSVNSKLVVNVNNRGRVPFINIGPQTNISLTFMRVHGLVAMGYNVDLVAVEKSSHILSAVSEALAEVMPVQEQAPVVQVAAEAVVEEAPKEDAAEALAEEAPKEDAAEALAEEAPKEDAAEALAEEAPKEEVSEAVVEEAPVEEAPEALSEEAPVEEEFVPFTKEELEALSEDELKEILTSGSIAFTLPKKNVKAYLVDLILVEQTK